MRELFRVKGLSVFLGRVVRILRVSLRSNIWLWIGWMWEVEKLKLS